MSDGARRVARRMGPWLWGVLVAAWLCRVFFQLAPGEMPGNHEAYNYVYRLIEFQDLLRAGYLFPQWASDFRGGLGSPYFGYYQPGFFYVASTLACIVSVPLALALTLWGFALVGYGGMLALVRARFGVAAGTLAATVYLLSAYAYGDLHLRGDLSEFAGMMLLAPALHCLTAWLDGGSARYWRATAACGAALVLAHPVAGLLGYGAMASVIVCWVASGADRRRAAGAVGALVAGVGLAGFYLVPLLLEWRFVAGDRVATATADVRLAFVELGDLFSLGARAGMWPAFVERIVPLDRVQVALAWVAIGTSLWRWRHRTTAQRRLVGALLVIAAWTTWLMHPTSRVLWDAVPLLRFVQFPWRALLVLTTALAAITGCLVEGRQVVALAGIALCAWSVHGLQPLPVRRWNHPPTARAMTETFVAPDIADEWLPRGALGLRGEQVPTAPACDGSVCRIVSFERGTARLETRIMMIGVARVVLPHYYFPVGWTATFEGKPVVLEPTSEGLMRVTIDHPLPVAEGRLDVRFHITPARRLGVMLTLAMVCALVCGAAWRRRRDVGR